MSIDALEAKAKTHIALNAIQTVADKVFIASVDAQIQTAISLGQFEITAVAGPEVNVATVYGYYNNLGYLCSFPDYLQQNNLWPPPISSKPPVFFLGFNWTQFWLNVAGSYFVRNPARMTIRWHLSNPWPCESAPD